MKSTPRLVKRKERESTFSETNSKFENRGFASPAAWTARAMFGALAVTLLLSLVSGKLSSPSLPSFLRFRRLKLTPHAVLLLLSYALKERVPISVTERNTLQNRNENGGTNHLVRKERERRGLRTREYSDDDISAPIQRYRITSQALPSNLKSSLKSTKQQSIPPHAAPLSTSDAIATPLVRIHEPTIARNELVALRDFWSSPSVYPRAEGEGSGIAGYRSTREIYAKPSLSKPSSGPRCTRPTETTPITNVLDTNPSGLPLPPLSLTNRSPSPIPIASTSSLGLSITTALAPRSSEKRSPSPILARRRRALSTDRANSPLRSSANSTPPTSTGERSTPRWVKGKNVLMVSTGKGALECDLGDLRATRPEGNGGEGEEDDDDYEDVEESAASTPPSPAGIAVDLPSVPQVSPNPLASPETPVPESPRLKKRSLLPLSIPLAIHRIHESAGSTPYSSPSDSGNVDKNRSLPFPPSKLSRRLS